MPGSGDSIRIPVSLQVDASEFQSIVSDLKQSVNKLAPDSKAYVRAAKDLEKLELEADNIAAALKQGFDNPGQIDKFRKKINDFARHLDVAAQQISKVKFEDLNLNLIDKEQLKNLDQLKGALDAAKAKAESFNTDKMRELVKGSAELQKEFDKLSLNVKTDSFDTAMKKAETRIQNLKKQIAEREPKAQRAQANLEHQEQLYNTARDMQKILDAKQTSDFRRTTANERTGNYAFNPNQKNLLLEQMKELGIDSETIEQIRREKESDLTKFWDSISKVLTSDKLKELQGNVDAARKVFEAETKPIVDAQDALKGVESLQRALEHIQDLQLNPNTEYGKAYNDLVKVVVELSTAYEDLKKQLLDLYGTQQEANTAQQQGNNLARQYSNSLEDLADSKRQDAAATKEADNAQKRLTDAIKRWFSFREVINLTKRAVVDAVNHIKELDATMTQIAVVTNMTQSDLWDQIGTYSAIAQQYGVTTNGVYQVSQLYYQMLVGAR